MTMIFVQSDADRALPKNITEAFPDILPSSWEMINSDKSEIAIILLDAIEPRDLVNKIKISKPLCPVIYLSMKPNAIEAFSVFRMGARGYCHAFSSVALLKQVVSVVEGGGIWVGPEFMPYLLQGVSKALDKKMDHGADIDAQESPLLEKLSNREQEVALEVAKGVSNKEVARNLNITERTVKAHLSAVFEKLGIRDRIHLVLVLKSNK